MSNPARLGSPCWEMSNTGGELAGNVPGGRICVGRPGTITKCVKIYNVPEIVQRHLRDIVPIISAARNVLVFTSSYDDPQSICMESFPACLRLTSQRLKIGTEPIGIPDLTVIRIIITGIDRYWFGLPDVDIYSVIRPRSGLKRIEIQL